MKKVVLFDAHGNFTIVEGNEELINREKSRPDIVACISDAKVIEENFKIKNS